jgi:hypothetical protein
MSFILRPVDTVDTISPADFKANYLAKRRPLVIKGLTKTWPAREKWNAEYLKQVVGNKTVPLYDNSKADPARPINSPAAEMPFDAYIDLIKSQPTELRIFFFNIFKQAPQLLDDIVLPKDLMGGFLESMPAMFLAVQTPLLFCIMILICRIFSTPISAGASMSYFLKINGSAVYTACPMLPTRSKTMMWPTPTL